jgi:hypothetical protein
VLLQKPLVQYQALHDQVLMGKVTPGQVSPRLLRIFPASFIPSVNDTHSFVHYWCYAVFYTDSLYTAINIVSGYIFCTSLWEISSLVINTCQSYQSLNDYYELARKPLIFQRAMDVILGHTISISLQNSVMSLKDTLKLRCKCIYMLWTREAVEWRQQPYLKKKHTHTHTNWEIHLEKNLSSSSNSWSPNPCHFSI